MIKSRRILIFGGQGYLGTNYLIHAGMHNSLISFDKEDINKHIFKNFTYNPIAKFKNISFKNETIQDSKAVKETIQEFDPTDILILSDISSIQEAFNLDRKSKLKKEAENFTALLNTIEKTKTNSLSTVLYASSYAVYGSHYLGSIAFTETYPHINHEDQSLFYAVKAIPYAAMKYHNEKTFLTSSIKANKLILRLPNIVGLVNPFNIWKRLEMPASYEKRILYKLVHSALINGILKQKDLVTVLKCTKNNIGSVYPIRNYVHVENICKVISSVLEYYQHLSNQTYIFNYTEDTNYYNNKDIITNVKKTIGHPPTVLYDTLPKFEVSFVGCDSRRIRAAIPGVANINSLNLSKAILDTSLYIMDKHMLRIKGISQSSINKELNLL